jgi:DNA end-binding protein Ku
MAPAQSDREKVRFNTLNRETGNRLRMRMLDAVTGETVDREDQVKGYEVAKGEYIQVEEEDLEAIRLESKHTIEITEFVDASEIDRLFLGDSHYLMPDDDVASEAYSVIRDAMARSGVIGIAKLTAGYRERYVAVQPRGKGILLTTLKFLDEIRDERFVFERIDDEPPAAKELEAMGQIIDQIAGNWDPEMFKDRYQDELKKILKAKQAGRIVQVKSDKKAGKDEKVVNLMDTLRKALATEKAGARRPKAASKTRSAKKGRNAA